MDQILTVVVRVLPIKDARTADLEQSVGTGFFLSKKHWVTCAHVVCEALGLTDWEELNSPEASVPFAAAQAGNGNVRWARVLVWKPASRHAESGDIAILEEVIGDEASPKLTDSQHFKSVAPLKYVNDYQEHRFVTYGFPKTVNNDAIPAAGILKLPRGNGWVSLQADSTVGEFVEGGYSGAPVWDENLKGIVGMIVLAKEKNRSAAMIPIGHLLQAWPSMGNLVDYPSPPNPKGRSSAMAEELVINSQRIGGEALNRLLNETESADFAENHQAEGSFLKQMEAFLHEQLKKSGDEYFLELSMKLAASDEIVDEGFQRNLSFALMLGDVSVSRQLIPGLNQLYATLQRKRSLVMLAPPGSGKTTVMQHLALRLIGEYRKQNSWLLPLFVPLTNYLVDPRTGDPLPILDFLRGWVIKLVGEQHFVAVQFDKLVKKGRFVFILDGLDQMTERRSETARLVNLRKVESSLRWMDNLGRIVRLAKRQKFDTWITQRQHFVSDRIAPQIDPREREIARLPNCCSCPVIVSCRQHDFIGVPRWQRIQVLPMDKNQIQSFVTKFAVEALPLVEQQWESAEATRSLVSNPFYLRMLTRAFEHVRGPDGSLPAEFLTATQRRGRLLRFLILQATEHEVKAQQPERNANSITKEDVLRRIGNLAYHMLEYNLIGGVPQEAVTRWLGDQSDLILRIAVNVGLVEIRPGPPASVEFNHQLFLETVLAFHLLERSEKQGGLEEALTLLARQGDRWAETIKLLFEMADDQKGTELVSKVVDALQVPTTWDLAKRVLSEVGRRLATQIVPLLQHKEALTRRGAAEILGRIQASEYVPHLVNLSNDPAWEVRRAAAEALIQMRQYDRLEKFAADKKPAVLRVVQRGRLRQATKPVEVINRFLASENLQEQEQTAWAALDLLDDLVVGTPVDDLATLLQTLVTHSTSAVQVVGLLAATRAPDPVKYGLKDLLLKTALDNTDPIISYLASCSVAPVLDSSDIQHIEQVAREEKIQPLKPNRSLRAYWLLGEIRGKQNLESYFKSLQFERQNDTRSVAQRLAARGDAMGFAVLTYMLSQPIGARVATEALVSFRPNGTRYLLAALDDPLKEVRLGAASFLKYCRLPRSQGRKVRLILRQNRVRSHEVIWAAHAGLEDPLNEERATVNRATRFQAYQPALKLGWTVGTWSAMRCLGIPLPLSFWWKYNLLSSPPTPELFQIEQLNLWIVHCAEQDAFASDTIELTAEFWLARGRFLHSIGALDAARICLDQCLARESTHTAARRELALILRSQHELENALRYLEVEDFDLAQKDSGVADLRQLIGIEIRLTNQEPQPEWLAQRIQLLVKLGQWSDAVEAVRQWCLTQPDSLPNQYYLLFQCYRGQRATMRAVAAALVHNNDAKQSTRIPAVEIDQLKWQHRTVPLAAVWGELGLLLDQARCNEAREMLRRQEIIPSSGSPPSSEQMLNLRRCLDNPETRPDLISLLSSDEDADLVARLLSRGEEEVTETVVNMSSLDAISRG